MTTTDADRKRARELSEKLYDFAMRYCDDNFLQWDEHALPLIEEALAFARPEWIAVAERMPKRGEWVLLWAAGHIKEVQMGQWDGPENGWWSFYRAQGETDFPMAEFVTHWMPLPAPPEGGSP